MFHVEQSVLNKGNNQEIYIRTKDFLVTGESFDLAYNQERDMLITRPQPPKASIARYYESDAYISHTDSKKGLMDFMYQLVKSRNLKHKEKLISTWLGHKGSVLDIGAGTGEFLKKAKVSGWTVQGMEVNSQARSLAADKGISLASDLHAIPEAAFDVVTLWHVLEHMHDLEDSIQSISSKIKKGGLLVVAAPNYNSFDAHHYGPHWAAYDTPRHLWHFSRKSIPRLFSKEFNLLDEQPLWFDAFYVSLLSEKYKFGKSFSIRGVLNGFRSNIQAKRTGEYSSLVYCLKKQG